MRDRLPSQPDDHADAWYQSLASPNMPDLPQEVQAVLVAMHTLLQRNGPLYAQFNSAASVERAVEAEGAGDYQNRQERELLAGRIVLARDALRLGLRFSSEDIASQERAHKAAVRLARLTMQHERELDEMAAERRAQLERVFQLRLIEGYIELDLQALADVDCAGGSRLPHTIEQEAHSFAEDSPVLGVASRN